MSRKTIGGIAGLCLLSVGLIFAGDVSVTPLNKSGYNQSATVTVEPVTRWVVQANATGADGSALASLYGWSGWSTAAREATAYAAAAANPYVGGRLVLCAQTQSRYEVVCLFDTATGTAALQLFQLSYQSKTSVPSANRGSLVYPSSIADVALGMPYSLSRDSGAQTLTFTANAETFKLGYSTTDASVYADETSGTTWYVGTRQVFDSSGGYAFLPYIVSIGGGATKVIVLGRPV